ncbi:MAG: helix-turn-helix domain-containing protein [Deltaproteobacteria bacterium]|nr:helix-turn-helix domain-containing protein [Deltaproteobacteria bacterium]
MTEWDDMDTTRLTREGQRPQPRRARTEDEILTSREAMGLLKIGRTKLWELTRDNVIPAYRVGNGKSSALRFKRVDLLAWLERNRI